MLKQEKQDPVADMARDYLITVYPAATKRALGQLKDIGYRHLDRDTDLWRSFDSTGVLTKEEQYPDIETAR